MTDNPFPPQGILSSQVIIQYEQWKVRHISYTDSQGIEDFLNENSKSGWKVYSITHEAREGYAGFHVILHKTITENRVTHSEGEPITVKGDEEITVTTQIYKKPKLSLPNNPLGDPTFGFLDSLPKGNPPNTD